MRTWKQWDGLFWLYGLAMFLDGVIILLMLGFYYPSFSWKAVVFLRKRELRKKK